MGAKILPPDRQPILYSMVPIVQCTQHVVSQSSSAETEFPPPPAFHGRASEQNDSELRERGAKRRRGRPTAKDDLKNLLALAVALHRVAHRHGVLACLDALHLLSRPHGPQTTKIVALGTVHLVPSGLV
jgi:hypothetical protein